MKFNHQGGVFGVPAADEFDAYYVPMVQTSDIAINASYYTLPTTHGSLKFMVTSQLSGCMFGTGSDANGAVLVSHVQPRNTIADLATRSQHLDTKITGQFEKVGGSIKRGVEPHGYENYAAVIAKRKGNHWSFYRQHQEVEFPRRALTIYKITSVERFGKI